MVTKKVSKKEKCTEKEFQDSRMELAAAEIRLEEAKKDYRKNKNKKRVKNCPECHGNKQVAIGNIGGVYGYRSGDNGYETCKKCKGKGYK